MTESAVSDTLKNIRRMKVVGTSRSYNGLVLGYDLVDISDSRQNVVHYSSEYILNAILRRSMVVDRLKLSEDHKSLVYVTPEKKKPVILNDEDDEEENDQNGKTKGRIRRHRRVKKTSSRRRKR